jgi:hypothetical protein
MRYEILETNEINFSLSLNLTSHISTKKMSELTVATRYAKSIIDLAQEQDIVDEIKADMDLFCNTLKANPRA